MSAPDWIREIIKANLVPNSAACSQFPKTDWEQENIIKNRMDKGFHESVPTVPTVPTEKESPCVLVENDTSVDSEDIPALPVRLVVSLPNVLDQSDDRILCSDCANLSRSGYCGKWGIVNPHNSKYRPVVDTLRRCGSFSPKYTATD